MNLKKIYEKICKELEHYEFIDGYHCELTDAEYEDWKYKEELAIELENTLGLPAREPRTIFYI